MDPTSISEDLEQQRFFRELSLDMRGRLSACAERVKFDKDVPILTEGGPADNFFVILGGRVAVGVHTPERGLAVIETLQAGDVLGWSWLFKPYRWNFDAVTTRPVRAIEFNARCLRPYLDQNPRAAFELVTGIAGVMEDRLQSARMRLIDLYGIHNATER